MMRLQDTQTLSPEEAESYFGDADGGDVTFSPGGGVDPSSAPEGFSDWLFSHWWGVLAFPLAFLVLIAIVVTIVLVVRRSRRAKREARDLASAQEQVARLGFDPSSLTVTAAGYALAMDGSARRIAVFHPRRPEATPELLGPDDVAGVRLDESSHVVMRRSSSVSHSDTDIMDSHFSTTTSRTVVDRVILSVSTNDVRRPLVQIPFIDADADQPLQGSRDHLAQLSAAKTWEARFQAFAAQGSRGSRPEPGA